METAKRINNPAQMLFDWPSERWRRQPGRSLILKGSTLLFDLLLDLCYFLTGGVVAAVALFVVYEVFVRYVLNDPTKWVIQGSEYGLVYLAFLAAGPVLRDGGHTKMTIILERLGPRNSRYLDAFTSLVGLAVCAVFSWQTITRIIESIARDATYKEGFAISQAAIWWVMPFAFMTMGLQFIRLFMEQAYNIKHDIVPGGVEDAAHGMA